MTIPICSSLLLSLSLIFSCICCCYCWYFCWPMTISPFASCPSDKYTYFYISISATFISWQFGFFLSRSREIIIKSVYACNWHLLQQRHNELYSSSIIPHIHKSCAFAKGQKRTQPFPISRKFLGEWLWKCWRCALKFSYLMLLRFFFQHTPTLFSR